MDLFAKVMEAFRNVQMTDKVIAGLCTAAILAVAKSGTHWMNNRVVLRRIRWRHDRDVESMLDLYSKLFPPDGKNYTAKELKSFLPAKGDALRPTHVKVEDIFFVARLHGEVIGFLFSCYYPDRAFAIIPYYGVNKEVKEARQGVAERLLKRLQRTLEGLSPSCKRIVFEAAKPTGGVPVEEKRERIARILRFQTVGRKLKRPVYEVQFNYTRPRLVEEVDALEEELSLMFCNLGRRTHHPHPLQALSKEELSTMLEFLHLDCYADVYPTDDPRHQPYYSYLKTRVAEIVKTVPDEVLLSSD